MSEQEHEGEEHEGEEYESPKSDTIGAKQDALEKRQDYLAREIRRIGGHLADVSVAVMRIEALAQGTAVHVRRMAEEKDITAEELARLDKEMRFVRKYNAEHEASKALDRARERDFTPRDRLPSYSDLSPTGKVEALTAKDAELMLAKQRITELEEDRKDRNENTRYWSRWVVAAIVGAVTMIATGVTVGYTVYRLTRPAMSLEVKSNHEK